MLYRVLALLAVASCLLTACGGGSDASPSAGAPAHSHAGATPQQSLAALRTQSRLLAASNAVAPQTAAQQLMDYGESQYPQYFPGHKPAGAVDSFVYRYYPETGIYLGVVVTAGGPFEYLGVYVMGGVFGNSPAYIGPLSFIITPVDSTPAFEAPAAQGTSGATLADPGLIAMMAPGFPAMFTHSLPIDFQGNGRPDLLACRASIPPYDVKFPCRVLRPEADGSLADVTSQVLGAGTLPGMEPREIVVEDFNGDGRPDIFLAAHGYDANPFPGAVNVLLVTNANGTYTDRSSTLPQTPDFTHSACAGDLDADGKVDIYVGNTSGANFVGPYFLMGKGDGTFTKKTTGLPPTIPSLQEKFLSCLIVDLDQDGFADLVLGTHGDLGYTDSIVLFNDGKGDFTQRARYVLPAGPLGSADSLTLDIVSLDIDRDGRPDLVLLSSKRSSTADVGMQALINQGGGTFSDETTARFSSSAHATGRDCGVIRVADLNGDGWEDFYCNIGPQDVANRYWINTGHGHWEAGSPSLPRGRDFGIHAVDFDGDGRPDLVQLSHTAEGGIAYQSFFNRTTRLVPSEPILHAAAAGDSMATLTFSVPLGAGVSPITSYAARCSTGTAAGVVTATGTASPLIVAGLANGATYACSVAAVTARGSSLASGEVRVKPQSQ
ncbi:MAG: VCBS repeat-containing protein [Burkholderiales bacterium]|nr:VCBS repeat-containing protein [Burkholderiales bacterium]